MPTEQQVEAVKRLTLLINTSEQRADGLIAVLSDMLSELPSLRRNAQFPAETGQPAVRKLTAAIGLLGEVRELIVEGHLALTAGAATLDLDLDPFTGERGPKPPPPTGELRPLKAA